MEKDIGKIFSHFNVHREKIKLIWFHNQVSGNSKAFYL